MYWTYRLLDSLIGIEDEAVSASSLKSEIPSFLYGKYQSKLHTLFKVFDGKKLGAVDADELTIMVFFLIRN